MGVLKRIWAKTQLLIEDVGYFILFMLTSPLFLITLAYEKYYGRHQRRH